jgi:hypothetical protein
MLMPSGDYALVAITGLKDGDETSLGRQGPQQRRIFREQLEKILGQLDYELYLRSLLTKAKVSIQH